MKKLLFLSFLFISFISSAQFNPTSSRVRFVPGIGIGTRDTSTYGSADTSILVMGKDSVLYYKYQGFFKPLGGSSAGKVNYTDTAAMLSPYLRSYLGVKYADTASMLNNYRTNINALISDSVYQASQLALKVNYTDTALMLSPYQRSFNAVKYTDTAAMLSGYKTFYPRTAISLTTTGSSGASTYSGSTGVLNVPTYTLAGLGGIGLTSLSVTNTGSSGAATYNNTTGVFNIPNYTLAGLGGIGLTSLSATAPLSYNNTTGAFSIPVATTSANGYLSSTDWTTFNGKQSAITLTTTGTSGAATFATNTLNIPNYTLAGLGGVPTTTTVAGFALSSNVTLASHSVGVGLLGTAYNGSTAQAWTVDTAGTIVSKTFASNIYQPKISLTTTGSSGAATFSSNTLNVPTYTLAGLGGIGLTALSVTNTGSSGAATYTNTTGVFNIPNYTLAGLGGQPLATNLTSIGGLANAAGVLRNNGTGTFSYDNTVLTANQAITVTATGDATGTSSASGTAPSIALTVGKINGVALSGLATGILKNTTTTGVPSIAVAGDFPTLNQNTTGSAASFTGSLAGDVTGTQSATVVGKINGVALSGLATGILKNTTTTGVPSIAVAGDFPTLNQSTTGSAGSVANAVTFNNGGTGAVSGTTYNGSAAQTISYNTLGASPLAGSASFTTAGTITTGVWNAGAVTSSGAVTGTSIVKSGGTASQILAADGSVITAGSGITISAGTIQASGTAGVTTFSAGTTGFTPNTATSGAVTLAGTLATTNGGTGVTSVTTTPTASAFAGWDANKNLSANNLLNAFTSTATAAGTTTLTVGSSQQQLFTGATTQTVVLPVVTTLTNGFSYQIANQSTGSVTVQTSGLNTLVTLPTNTMITATVVNTAGGTGTASWVYDYSSINTTGAAVVNSITFGTTGLTPSTATSGAVSVAGTLIAGNGGTGQSSYAIGDLLSANTTSTLSKIADVAAGQPLLSGGVSTLPAYAGYTFSGTAAQTYTFPSTTKTLAANDGSNWTFASQAIGDIAYASSTTAYTRLADVAVGSYLRSGGVGTAPLWSTLILPNAATTGDLMIATGTNTIGSLADAATGNVLISGGAGVAPSYGKVALASAVSGTLPIANGGTNSATALSGSSIMVSNGTGIIQGTAGTTTTVLHGNAAGTPTYSAVSLTADVTGTLPIANGGTNLTALPTTSAASTFAAWDANKNISANNFASLSTSTATAAGTTTLTVASAAIQNFTGTTTQTVVLPVVTTLTNGFQFTIFNNSTGVVTVQSSGLNTIAAMAAGTTLQLTCTNTAGGTGTASWAWQYLVQGASTPSMTSITFGTTGLTPSTATGGAVTVAGTLAVGNGGTGATTLTGLVKGNGTSAFTAAVAGTDYVSPSGLTTSLASYLPLAGGTLTGNLISNSAAGNYFRTTNTTNTTGFDVGLLGGSADATAYVYNRANAGMIFATNSTTALTISNTQTAVFSSTIQGTQIVAQRNDAAASPNGIQIQGSTNSNQQLLIGYNTTSDYGSIQPVLQGTGYKNLVLNGAGGSVLIGTTTNHSSETLQVNGSGYFTGNVNIASTTSSTSATTGALVVAGGVGVTGVTYLSGGAFIGGLTVTSNMAVNGTIQLFSYTVATLPTASSFLGCIAFVTDATSPTWGATVVGGGAVKTLVWSNGTNWTVR